MSSQLIFYNDAIRTNTVDLHSHYATALAYDEIHNTMLYVDKQRNNDSICGYNLLSMENKCFINRNIYTNISSIAFDPVTDTLFFTDPNERSINWISLKPGLNNNGKGNLLIRMDDRHPTHIALDSCIGYIYWVNSDYRSSSYIEKARFDGSGREVVDRYLTVFSFALDPQTGLYYRDHSKWLLDKYLNSLLLAGKELSYEGDALSNEYLYYTVSNEAYKSIWRAPKTNLNNKEEQQELIKFYVETPVALAANYRIKDQIQGKQDCEALSNLISTTTGTGSSFSVQDTTETEQTTESTCFVELFCVNGTKISETSVCKCSPGYIGDRCDVSVCENYCLQGDCSFNLEGLPKCRCNAGYSGERCEVYACHSFCLNNGDCTLNEEEQPVCQCVGNHEGTRCEVAINDAFTNTRTLDFVKRNLTLADLFSNWRKPASKMFVTVEV